MKISLQIIFVVGLCIATWQPAACFSQTFQVLQDFENGGTGTDGCWTGYNHTSNPTTTNFFTTTSPVQTGTYSGGMYSCCGGPGTNDPTYYISPILITGSHAVLAYLRQSSSFNENFEIGSVSDTIGSNFILTYTKSIWPNSPAWELASATVSTNNTNNRVAFRVPPSSLKTYYLDSIVIGNSGHNNLNCNYSTITSVDFLEPDNNSATVFPNPFNEFLTIQLKKKQPAEIVLYDIRLKNVYQNQIAGSSLLNTDQLDKGMYFFEIRNSNGVLSKGKLVKN